MSDKSFLDALRRRGDDQNNSGDEFGGGAGRDGSGLPDGRPGNFMFATGIECSYPMTRFGRRDLLEETGHYERFKEDFSLTRDLGLKVLRYGLPYHRISLGPGRFDWSFADESMNEIRRLEITPILDLLHFGLPDWIGDFQNPEMPVLFADYAEAVARRYPWVRYYTPVNEIFVTARASAWDGSWNEQRKKDGRAFVTALKHCCAASILACHRIARHRNDCVIVQSETAEIIHQAKPVRDEETQRWNKLRFASLDLLYAHAPDADIMLFLLDNGMTRAEYDWFMVGEPPGYQIMGNDYYGRNEKIMLPDKSMIAAEDVFGWYQITKEYHDRYQKPVMHTETNHFDPEIATTWLWKQWLNVLKMRADGVPVLGFTWYSLIDQIDWDTGLAEKNGTVQQCGLYDLQRRPRKVATAYRQLLESFGQITVVPHGELFEVTNRPASLKVQV